jgi:hypothetical protein
MRLFRTSSIAVAALALLLPFTVVPSTRAADERPKAPELRGGDGWIGSDRDLELADFKGKVVLLDFWTFG